MFKVIDLVGFHVSITHEAHCHSQDSEHTHFPTVSLVTVDYFAFSRILYEWILLQGIFLTQGLNPDLPPLQADTLPSEPPGKPRRRWILL